MPGERRLRQVAGARLLDSPLGGVGLRAGLTHRWLIAKRTLLRLRQRQRAALGSLGRGLTAPSTTAIVVATRGAAQPAPEEPRAGSTRRAPRHATGGNRNQAHRVRRHRRTASVLATKMPALGRRKHRTSGPSSLSCFRTGVALKGRTAGPVRKPPGYIMAWGIFFLLKDISVMRMPRPIETRAGDRRHSGSLHRGSMRGILYRIIAFSMAQRLERAHRGGGRGADRPYMDTAAEQTKRDRASPAMIECAAESTKWLQVSPVGARARRLASGAGGGHRRARASTSKARSTSDTLLPGAVLV